MAEDRMMTPADVVAKAMAGEHGDLLREAVSVVVRELMDAEVEMLTALAEASAATGASRISTAIARGLVLAKPLEVPLRRASPARRGAP